MGNLRKIVKKQFPIFALFVIVSMNEAYGYVFDDYISGFVSNWPPGLSICILTLIPAMIFHWYYKGEFDGFLGLSGFFPGLLFLTWPIAHIFIGIIGSTGNIPSLRIIFFIFAQALYEEIACRGLVCSYCMRHINKPEHIPIFTVIAGLTFGLLHILNLLDGTAFLSVLDQVFTASLFGILLTAAFLRTGTIWPGVLIHTLWNIGYEMRTMSYAAEDAAGELIFGLTELPKPAEKIDLSNLGFDIFAGLITATLYLVPYYILTRPAIRGRIINFWQGKWNKAVTDNQE